MRAGACPRIGREGWDVRAQDGWRQDSDGLSRRVVSSQELAGPTRASHARVGRSGLARRAGRQPADRRELGQRQAHSLARPAFARYIATREAEGRHAATE